MPKKTDQIGSKTLKKFKRFQHILNTVPKNVRNKTGRNTKKCVIRRFRR